MKSFLRSRDGASKGAALMIVLAIVVLLTGLSLAYFSRTTTDRQLAQSSYNDTSADLLGRSALDLVVSDFKQELLNNPTVSASNIQPTPYGTPSPGQTPIPNLIRRSFSGDPTGLTSSINSTAVSANGRSISMARWNSHYFIPRLNTGTAVDSTPILSFVAPDWVIVTAQGPQVTPSPSAVIGRYAFAVYDEGGVLDMNQAGFPDWPAATTGPASPPTPTPWGTNVGRKGLLALADLTALEGTPGSTPLQSQVNKIVGWRNFANTGQSDGSFGAPSFSSNRKTQDGYGSYLLDFGDPPYASPSPFPTDPFTTVDPTVTNSRTDQAFMTRQELLKLQSSLGFSQNLLQYMGTFSRERNQPARDWGTGGKAIGSRLPDRFDITNLGLVKPNPGGTPKPNRGKGQNKGVGRGRFRGDAASILDLFGLKWVEGMHTNPATGLPMPNTDVRYWPHWLYVGRPGMPTNCDPGNGCAHIPALRGGRNDFFQILDYAIRGQANGDFDDTANIAVILGIGASLIDQYDVTPADDVAFPATSPSPRPSVSPWPTASPSPTDTTIIAYNGGYVLGWERQDKETNDPHGPLGKATPAPSPSPIVLDHGFTTTAELGNGLKTEATPPDTFAPLNLHTSGTNESALLDFFTYNPVDHSYPRLGIVNLNTKNAPVLAAILQMTLKKDFDTYPAPSPSPTPAIIHSEALAAAQAIVNATSAGGGAAVNRSDIARLTDAVVAAGAINVSSLNPGEEQDKGKEAIARALSEVGQARTWNLMIDVIAQTGKYKPNAPDLSGSNFFVEGEKRYWLHIALGRDLVSGQVDVLGTQLEEVVE
jgi:hypothetical protein